MKKTKIAAYTCSIAMASALAIGGVAGKSLRADEAEEPQDPNPAPVTGLEISEENFPDEKFRGFVGASFDTNSDGILDDEEIASVKKIDLDELRVTTLKGIENFANLTDLNCARTYGVMTELDVSANTELVTLDLSGNFVKTLDLSNNTKLTSLKCNRNLLSVLDISNCTQLKEIECYSNSIEVLDISKCTGLKKLDCDDNKIKKLDVSAATELTRLEACTNMITTIDLSNCAKLEHLEICENPIKKLDLQNCKKLEYIDVFSAELTSLDLHDLSAMKTVVAMGAPLKEINVTGCTNLDTLVLDSTKITSLDLSTNAKLVQLSLNAVPLKSLDLTNKNALEYVSISMTSIYSLDVRSCAKIMEFMNDPNFFIDDDGFDCYYVVGNTVFLITNSGAEVISSVTEINEANFPDAIFREYVGKNFDANADGVFTSKELANVKKIDLSGTEVASLKGIEFFSNLETLNVEGPAEGGKLTSMELSANTMLTSLNCSNQPLKELNLDMVFALRYIDCSNTQIKALDVKDYNKLQTLKIHHTQITSINLENCDALVAALTDNGVELKMVDDYYVYADANGKTLLSCDPTTKIVGVDGLPTPAPTATPTPTMTPTPVPHEATVGEFVERLYTEALGRPAEESGKNYWVNEITNGRKTGGDCGLFFLTGEEFTNRNLSVENFVETLYKTFFGRASEASGKAYWVGVLKNGGDRTAVIKGFIDSKEWCNLCADYGVRSGAPSAKAEKASKNATKFAKRLYTCCLGRDPEDAGLAYWALALTNAEQTGCSAAKQFFTGAEFVNQKVDNEEYVRRLYLTFMGRDPEASEISYWAGEISKGTQTRDSVLAFFGQSDEFSNLCAKYGIERDTI